MDGFFNILDITMYAFDDFISTGSYIVDRNKQHIKQKKFSEFQFAILFVKFIVFTYIAIKMIIYLRQGKTTYKESVRLRLLISLIDLIILSVLIKLFISDYKQDMLKEDSI